MKETGCVLLKSGALTAEDLEKINRYTRRAFQEEELYTFSVVLCDNEVDRDMERFTIPALERLGELFLGKCDSFAGGKKSADKQQNTVVWITGNLTGGMTG